MRLQTWIFAFCLSLMLGATAPAFANCPEGAALRNALERVGQEFAGPPMNAVKREDMAAYAILVWDAFGRSNLTGDVVAVMGVRGCYSASSFQCGVAKDDAIAKALAASVSPTGPKQAVTSVIPERPPEAMVNWARQFIGGACATATTRQVNARSIAAVQPRTATQSASATVGGSCINPRPTPSGATKCDNPGGAPGSYRLIGSEAQINAYRDQQGTGDALALAQMRGNVHDLLNPPLVSNVTPLGAGQAMNTYMDRYIRVRGSANPAFGLEGIAPNTIRSILPQVRMAHRNRLSYAADVLERDAARAARIAREQQQLLDRIAAAKDQVRTGGYYTPTGPVASSGGLNPAQKAQREAYLRGKANRDACTTSNPCGPGNEFRIF